MDKTIMAEGKPLFSGQDLWRLIWPLLIEQFLSVLVGAADTMMVSNAGEAAISGVSLVDMINVLIINVFAALATGGAVVVSQYIGAKHPGRANRSASQLVLLAAVLGASIGILCIVFAVPILNTIYAGIDAYVFDACLIYFRITAISFPFLALYNAGAAIFRSMGNSRVSMLVSILMNLINIAGNAVCIFLLHMGVAGVAVPSVISRGIAALLILRLAARKDNDVRIAIKEMEHLDWKLSKRILHIGIPSAFENSLFQLGRIVVVNMITYFGTVQISANAVANNIDSLFCVPGQAMSLAMITVVGRCIGARDEKQTIHYTKVLVLAGYGAMFISGTITLVLLPLIMNMYALSGETRELAMLLIRIHNSVGMILWPMSFIFPNALRAAGDVKYTMSVSISSMVIWRIGLSCILALGMGLGAIGVWIAMIADWTCRIICFTVRFIRGGWKSKYSEG